MKLWRFTNPRNIEYARAGRCGTWQGKPARRVRPLIIEWEPDSDVIGDFTWPGFDSDIIITDSVAECLKDYGVPGFELGPVIIQENTEHQKRRANTPRVMLPYNGPPLWDLWVTAWTNLDPALSTVTSKRRGDGSRIWEVTGAQRKENLWDPKKMELIPKLHPRIEGQGIFVPPIRGLFRIKEFPAWIFCTGAVKRLIEDHAFTNVSFLEMGDVLDE